MKASLSCAQAGKPKQRKTNMDNNEGYSPLFYWMLLIGIIGVLGFFVVAAGAAGGI